MRSFWPLAFCMAQAPGRIRPPARLALPDAGRFVWDVRIAAAHCEREQIPADPLIGLILSYYRAR